jgi:hypothetical protein
MGKSLTIVLCKLTRIEWSWAHPFSYINDCAFLKKKRTSFLKNKYYVKLWFVKRRFKCYHNLCTRDMPFIYIKDFVLPLNPKILYVKKWTCHGIKVNYPNVEPWWLGSWKNKGVPKTLGGGNSMAIMKQCFKCNINRFEKIFNNCHRYKPDESHKVLWVRE